LPASTGSPQSPTAGTTQITALFTLEPIIDLVMTGQRNSDDIQALTETPAHQGLPRIDQISQETDNENRVGSQRCSRLNRSPTFAVTGRDDIQAPTEALARIDRGLRKARTAAVGRVG
jgi:hypothetical protein